LGELFREAAILIGVFGSLDPILKGNRFQVSWAGIVGGVTISLFLLGLYFTVMAERNT
jgi:membrane associated rhomboid family serine protease